MSDYLEERKRPLRISRTAPHFSPTPDLDLHPSASPARCDFSNDHITGPVADRAHGTKPHSTFSTRSVLSGVLAFLRPNVTGPTRNFHHGISKVFQPSAEDPVPVPVRTCGGVQRRGEAKCASRCAARRASPRPKSTVRSSISPPPRLRPRDPRNPRPRNPARRRSVSVAPPAATSAQVLTPAPNWGAI